MLTTTDFNLMETALAHTLNAAYQEKNMTMSIEIASLMIKQMDTAASLQPAMDTSPVDSKQCRRAQVLSILADSHLTMNHISEAAAVSRKSFEMSPAVESFLILFRCSLLSEDPIGQGNASLQVTTTHLMQ